MMEIKKLGLNMCFARKHCFPNTLVLKGKGYSGIQAHLGNLKRDHILKEVRFDLTTAYCIINSISLSVRNMNFVEAQVVALEKEKSDELSTQGLTS